MTAALAILTRSTSDPRNKTRLAARIPSEAGRRELVLAFLDDLIDRCETLPGVAVRLAVTAPVEALRFDRPAIPGSSLLAQRGATLDERLLHVLEDLAARGFTRVVMISSDVPDLRADYLQGAFALLENHPGTVVLGPSDDGGCYLIGAAVSPGAVPDVFSDVRWGTPHVIDDMTAAAARAGLAVVLLDSWSDVDVPADLDALAERLKFAPAAAPKTAAVLKTLGLIQNS